MPTRSCAACWSLRRGRVGEPDRHHRCPRGRRRKANGVQNDTIAKLIKQARKYEPVIDKLDPSNKRQLQVLIYILTVATPVAPSPDDPAKSAELAKIAAEIEPGSTARARSTARTSMR